MLYTATAVGASGTGVCALAQPPSSKNTCRTPKNVDATNVRSLGEGRTLYIGSPFTRE